MRLTRLHLAGFKSFAAPTDVLFPSPLVAIVGPNGCGKSNLIDAVRWVLGESAARHLRGQSLDDVIFAGGSDRAAASKASVVLDFDNSEGRLSGPFAHYNQISIRRELGRDGQSRYFINNTRVRRRDITDLFLGTGVGARSYSVIEQGQVNRIIDAKPEELRAYLEEAAGISVYRERRRETETRIRHSRENLERLGDLVSELARQQATLERQAKAAERYARLKADWRTVLVEQAGLERALAERALRSSQDDRQQREAARAEAEGRWQQTQTTLQQAQVAQSHASDAFRNLQAEHYRLRGDLAQVTARAGELAARIESAEQQQQDDRASRQRLTASIEALVSERETLLAEQQRTEQQLADLREQAVEARSALRHEEDRLQDIRSCWRDAVEALNEPQQARAHAEAECRSIERQLERLTREAEQAAEVDFAPQLADLEERRTALIEQHEALAEQIASGKERLAELDRRHEAQQAVFENSRRESDALRQARDALRAEESGLRRLLPAQVPNEMSGSAAQIRLIDRLVQAAERDTGENHLGDDWWGHVLGDCIEAQCVDDLQALAASWSANSLPERGCWVMPHRDSDAGADDLVPWLADWQASRRRCDSLDEALSRRDELLPGHCFVLPDGWRVGRHWMARPDQDAAAAQLAQRLRLSELEAELVRQDAACTEAETAVASAREALQAIEAERRTARSDLQRQEQELARFDIDRHDLERQHHRLTERRAEWQAAQETRAQDQTRLAADLAEARQSLETHEAAVQERAAARDGLAREQQAAETTLQDRRRASGQASGRLHETEREHDRQRNRLNQIEQIEARDREQIRAIEERLARFDERLEALAREREVLREEQQRRQAEIDALADRERGASGDLEAAEAEVHRLATSVAEAQTALDRARQVVQTAELAVAQAEVHANHADTAFADAVRQWLDGRKPVTVHAADEADAQHESGAGSEVPLGVPVAGAGDDVGRSTDDIEALLDPILAPVLNELERLPDQAEALKARIEERRAGLERQIERLGAVNLTAIEAHAEVSARKTELDEQIADVTEALERLEQAMRTMDRETRQRFREVFESVNDRLGPRFNQLFGGGEARLELTEADELVAGVALFARPPGKKVSHLSLLSGGEKALTAVALIFAIFELNPAPFCILDEIDAPLDEANVGRFCAMVSSMSDRVQFIYITHNKATMASASALIGVTMREAGVSRVVSVDIDRAVAMAESPV